MARLVSTLTLLFFVFSFAYARTPFDFTENEVIDVDVTARVDLPKSETEPTLLLPGEKSESETTNTVVEIEPEIPVVEIEPEIPEAEPLDLNPATEDLILPVSDTQSIDAVPLTQPLTIVRFRPVNRHFPGKRPYGLRGCRHHMMKHRSQGREVSYGNDMILAGGERKEFNQEMLRGGVRQIPATWMKLPHHRHHHDHEGMPRFAFGKHHRDMFAKQSFRRPFHREEEEEEERKYRKRGEERENGGFMMRVRKFLNHF